MSDRRANPSDPTAERTAESSTQTATGPSGGRPGIEQARRNDDADEAEPEEMSRADDASRKPKI